LIALSITGGLAASDRAFARQGTPPPARRTPFNPSIGEYVADGLGQTVAKFRASSLNADDQRRAARHLKLLAHHYFDSGADLVVQQAAKAADWRQFDPTDSGWKDGAVAFFGRYDSSITRADLFPNDSQPLPDITAVVADIKANGMSAHLFRCAEILKAGSHIQPTIGRRLVSDLAQRPTTAFRLASQDVHGGAQVVLTSLTSTAALRLPGLGPDVRPAALFCGPQHHWYDHDRLCADLQSTMTYTAIFGPVVLFIFQQIVCTSADVTSLGLGPEFVPIVHAICESVPTGVAVAGFLSWVGAVYSAMRC
jgi:hypothetical protein